MSPRRKLLVAIGIGVVLSGPPVAALNLWLNGLVNRQGREELDMAARRHMVLSEARIARAVVALDELAARGIDSCRASHVDALRQTNFATIPVKELSIVTADGRTLCTDVGNQLDQRKVVSSEPLSAGSRDLLELVHIGGRSEQWVRIRRPGDNGNGVAALIPVSLFVPQVSTRGGPLRFQARMLTARGAVIADIGEAIADPSDAIVSSLVSSRYGLKATVAASVNLVGGADPTTSPVTTTLHGLSTGQTTLTVTQPGGFVAATNTIFAGRPMPTITVTVN